MGHEEVPGPAPTSLVKPAENAVRASSSGESTGDNIGLPMPQAQRGDSSRPIDGQDVTIPPGSEGHSHQDLSRRDRDAEIEIVAQRAAEQAIALLEQRYSRNRRQTADYEERRLLPAHARGTTVALAGYNLSTCSRRSSPHVSSKRVTGVKRPRRQGVPEDRLPPSRGPRGLLPYHPQAASTEPEIKMLDGVSRARMLEYPEEGRISAVIPLNELPGIDHALDMALSRQFPEFEVGRIAELSDSGSQSDDRGGTPDHSLPNSEPESESTVVGEQYDGNAYDSDSLSHIAVEPSDSEGNSTSSRNKTVEKTIVGRSHEPNHPEPGTGNALIYNDADVSVNNSTSNENSTQPIRNVRKPEARKVKRPLLAETRTRKWRVRKITWRMKEIPCNAGYNPDADFDVYNTEGPGAVPQFRTLLALAPMARRSQAMEYFTGPEREGWLAAAQKELNSFKQKGVFTEIDPSKIPRSKTIIPMKWVLTKKYDTNGEFKSYKARMVCQGFRQKPGMDYDPDNISSSVARLETLSVFIAIAASLNLKIRQAEK